MPTRSGPLAYATLPVTTPGDVFTVPTGMTFILKTVLLNNNVGSLAHITLIAKDAVSALALTFAFQAINTGQPITLTTWLVFGPGDKLQGFADGTPCLVAAYGASLIGSIR